MKKKLKQIKLLNQQMRFVEVELETLIDSDVFDLIRTGQINKQQFASWAEHQRDEWFHNGMNINNQG